MPPDYSRRTTSGSSADLAARGCRRPRLMDEHELDSRWSCSPKTLRNQRSLGTGCPFLRIGSLVRYRLSDVWAYEKAAESK